MAVMATEYQIEDIHQPFHKNLLLSRLCARFARDHFHTIRQRPHHGMQYFVPATDDLPIRTTFGVEATKSRRHPVLPFAALELLLALNAMPCPRDGLEPFETDSFLTGGANAKTAITNALQRTLDQAQLIAVPATVGKH
jgi:hypothetical protein